MTENIVFSTACYFAKHQALDGKIVNTDKQELTMSVVSCSGQLLFDFPSFVLGPYSAQL